MGRQVALLGGINVGGHRVTMERLRAEMEAMGLDDVSTFIASGNVMFSSRRTASTLEPAIEAHLAEQLGWPVPTFVRSVDRLRVIAACEPFGELPDRSTHHVLFLRTEPDSPARAATEALSNDQDRFVVIGSEVHWSIHGKLTDSSIRPGELKRAIGVPHTARNITSVRKLVATLDR